MAKNTIAAEPAVLSEKKGNIAWVTMNRGASLNSLTAELCDALVAALAECERDEDIRAVILCSAGKAFCAGGDLRTIALLDDVESAKGYVRTAGNVVRAVVKSRKPYIAMVGGAAAGAGFNLALACDFICASKRAKFTQAFSSIGLISDCGGNLLLPRLVGSMTAKKLMMLPETITAEEAERLGIVTITADESDLRNVTSALAERLAKQPSLAIAEIKRIQNDASAIEEILRTEEEIQARLIMSEDCKEGVRAFFEKRKADFREK
ncbi:MAG: enoyl-CoA hydratase/isomerase family protein [Synergistes sp.]|nr:enoyl-CoA hydratase/isomerase family protein [Synergistes sp.]